MNTNYILDRIQATIEYAHEHNQHVSSVELSKQWMSILIAESNNGKAPTSVFGYPLFENDKLFDYKVVVMN